MTQAGGRPGGKGLNTSMFLKKKTCSIEDNIKAVRLKCFSYYNLYSAAFRYSTWQSHNIQFICKMNKVESDYLTIQTSKHMSALLKIYRRENFLALICLPADKFCQLFIWCGNFSVDSGIQLVPKSRQDFSALWDIVLGK